MSRLSFSPFGFSLVEMMVAVAIIGIAVAIAMPTMPRFGADQRLGAVAYDLSLRIRELRSQAVSGERGLRRTPGNIGLLFPKSSLVLKRGVDSSSRSGVVDASVSDRNEVPQASEELKFSSLYGESYYLDLGKGRTRLNLTFGGDGVVQWACTPSCSGSQYISLAVRSVQSAKCYVVQISGVGLVSSYLSSGGPCAP